ncbi:hypothetical protein BDZ45DRAFT_753246 [Acephala macrosclerotiorum]|nr:hypothetical protein BDZ45DRAFT_753246 [Acephala macrosclerotiorum]
MGDAKLASQVCWNCKVGKRKCSKDLPACARCSKLLLKCDYDYNLTDASTQNKVSSPTSSVEGSSLPSLQTASRLMAALSENSPRTIKLEANIPSQVLNVLINNGEGVPSVTSNYFRTIDVWLPVIAPEPCLKRLETITADNNVELASLLLAMFLATRPPGPKTGAKEMQTPLYFDTKTLYAFMISSGRCSIEIIQAGFLISLYEIGHGMTEAAQVTMIVISRLATKMKVRQYRNSSTNIQNTEFGRLWWGIVTLDRYLNQGLAADEIQLLVGTSSDGVPSMELPTDDEAGLPPPISMRTTSGISASNQPTTRLGPFCRASEAGHFLGQVIDLVAESSHTGQMNEEKSRALDSSLRVLAGSLFQRAINGWEECCAAIGLCLSALVLLHERTWILAKDTIGQETRKQAAGMALRSAIRMVIDISRRFHMDLAFIDLPALPLPATYAVYRTTVLYIQLAGDEFQGSEWSSNMDSLKSTLGHFGKRWNVGKYYLEVISDEMSNEIERRSRNGDGSLAGAFHKRVKIEATNE